MAVPADKLNEALATLLKKILANIPQSLNAYKRLYNINESLTLEKKSLARVRQRV